ncbi:DoxX family protein [Brevundimonas sp.]|jgi:hypothetical protein|uniref:DoxX family protein n=1 Tax=Brevundimonas sp. TaxID=1871086 RepID=UPI0037C0FA05
MTLAVLMSSAGPRRLSRFYRHLALWVLQSWLAMFYIAAGYAKLTQPQDMLAVLMTWPADASLRTIQLIGWAELLLATAMIAPLASWSLLRRPMLVAAVCLMAEATLMAIYHASTHHAGHVVTNAALATMSLLVVVGRRGARASP